MTVTEYLRRLNLLKYAPNFSKNKVFFLSDLRFDQSEGALKSKFGISDQMLAKRMAGLMSEDKQVKEDFKLLSHN